MSDLPVRNSSLLERIAAAIEEYPDQHNQTSWSSLLHDLYALLTTAEYDEAYKLMEEDPEAFIARFDFGPSCGTAYCIAGWSQVLQGRHILGSEVFSSEWPTEDGRCVHDQARVDLGLTPDEAAILFHGFARGRDGLTFTDALRKFAVGAPVEECFVIERP